MEKKWSDHLKMGQIQLNSRICLAAMTRQRCKSDGIPTDLVSEYYCQRSMAGLMLTQSNVWSPKGEAFPGAASLYTKQQAEGWKKVVDEIHKKGGKIFVQLFHAGRATHPKLSGHPIVYAPSPIAVRQSVRGLDGEVYPVPKEMTLDDINETKSDFRKSIEYAKESGFDGVQIHGATGDLLDQFLRSETNKRTDNYGGSVQNRVRLMLELFDIALEYFQPFQLGAKISPVSRIRDMCDQNPEETYSYLLKELSKKQIGFVEIRQSTQSNLIKNNYELSPSQQMEKVSKTLKQYFTGILIANDSFTPQKGLKAIQQGEADMISFARLYISNPDLTERILKGQELNNKHDHKTFYGHHLGSVGYTDYPVYDEWIKNKIPAQTK